MAVGWMPRASASSRSAITAAGNGRISYRGREMTGLGRCRGCTGCWGPTAGRSPRRGWFDSEAISLDGPLVYVAWSGQSGAALRFQQGVYACARRVVPLPPAARKCLTTGAGSAGDVRKGCRLAGTLIAISERASIATAT